MSFYGPIVSIHMPIMHITVWEKYVVYELYRSVICGNFFMERVGNVSKFEYLWLFSSSVLFIFLMSISYQISLKKLKEIQHTKKHSIFFFLIDGDGKISLSRFQLYLWSCILISLIFSLGISNYVFNIPKEVYWILGINLTSFAGGNIIGSSVRNKRGITRDIDPYKIQFDFSEMFSEIHGGPVSIARFQNFAITLLLMILFISAVLKFEFSLTGDPKFPILDSYFYILLGVSHIGYLSQKFYAKIYNPQAVQILDLPENSLPSKPIASESRQRFSLTLSKELNSFICIRFNNMYFDIPYCANTPNSVEDILSSLKASKAPVISTQAQLTTYCNTNANSKIIGIGNADYIKHCMDSTLKILNPKTKKTLDISYHISTRTTIDILPGAIIEMYNGTEIFYLIVNDVSDTTISFASAFEHYGPHFGFIKITDWNKPLDDSVQVWHDKGFTDANGKHYFKSIIIPNVVKDFYDAIV